jgi:16S rRNA G966 N2-methylase RsmD
VINLEENNMTMKFRLKQTSNKISAKKTADHILDLTDISHYNSNMSANLGVMYERIYFGMPITQAVETGYKVTCYGYFDSTESPSALNTAETIQSFLPKRVNGTKHRILDMFCGTGQMSWAFIKHGFSVTAFEKSKLRYLICNHNLTHAFEVKINKRLDFTLCDGVDSLKNLQKENVMFDAIYLDPPWANNYNYNLGKPFFLEDMDPDGYELVKLALKSSRLVALKCPQNISINQLRKYFMMDNVSIEVHFQNIKNFPDSMNQVTIYFKKEGELFNLKTKKIVLL